MILQRIAHQDYARLELGSLEGQRAVITGGGTGIGAAVALAVVAAKARKFGVIINVAFQSADISTSSGQLEVVHNIKADLPNVDILVQNAATFAAAPIETFATSTGSIKQTCGRLMP